MALLERKRLFIFGTGLFSEIIYEYLKSYDFDIIGFIEDRKYNETPSFCGLPVFIKEDRKSYETYTNGIPYIYVALGYGGEIPNKVREEKLKEILNLGFKPFTFIHDKAIYYQSSFANSNHNFVFELNNIQPFVEVGDNNIFWSGNHIGHHSKIGSNNFFSSHVVISGNCTVGNNNFFGVNSTIIDGVTIGNGCIIGAGSLVLRDVPDNTKVLRTWTGRK